MSSIRSLAVSIIIVSSIGCSQWKLVEKAPFTQTFPEMIVVEGGTFKMGSLTGGTDEQPTTTLLINTLAIGRYEVTTAQFRNFCVNTKRIMPAAPSWGWQDLSPITNVSWDDAVAYCQWISEQTGQKYRLPTEAEWEFAARGGIVSKGSDFSGSTNLDEVGWYLNDSDNMTHPCGQKKVNEVGLFDMSGNVGEWCSSLYALYPYTDSNQSTGDYRVIRGGHYKAPTNDNRVYFRGYNKPTFVGDYIGFRVVRQL